MRRLILLFAALIVPLQLSWAAAAVYCGHEGERDSGHFGHHQCAHDAGAAKDPGENGQKGLDKDCGSCHSHGTAYLPGGDVESATAIAPADFPHFAQHIAPSPGDPPYRPDRPSLA
jgi:hypothetical protein